MTTVETDAISTTAFVSVNPEKFNAVVAIADLKRASFPAAKAEDVSPVPVATKTAVVSILNSIDMRQVEPLLAQLQSNVDVAELKGKLNGFLGDAGYFSESNVNALVEAQLDPYVATQWLKHNEQIPEAPRGRLPEGLSSKQRMARKLRTKKGRETYSKRKWIVCNRCLVKSKRVAVFVSFYFEAWRTCRASGH